MGGSKPQESDVRIEHSLNKKEEEFVARRRKDVLQSLKKLNIICSEGEVPNIALLGSGGGERAMVGLLGSLDQLQKIGLLDCMLYLSGVSGSTWCMASLYQEPDWSTKLETVKDEIIQRLSGPASFGWKDAYDKLEKYYEDKDIFSLTDVWAAMFVSENVKEIDEHTLSDHRGRHNKDPFPIYTAIDKNSKHSKDGDPWFEFTPYEAGYSLTGAFVETSNFGSKFKNGRKIKNQPEIDMLYLQALCGSALAEEDEIKKTILEKIKELLSHFSPFKSQTTAFTVTTEDQGVFSSEDPAHPSIAKSYQVLMHLVDLNLSVLDGKDPSDLEKCIRNEMSDITGGKHEVIYQTQSLKILKKSDVKQHMKKFTEDVCNDLTHHHSHFGLWTSIFKCLIHWIWGRKYDFLRNMKNEAVPAALLKSETRDYEDAGLLLNSPYFSVLREERNIDLIISLDFSEGDPFMTVRDAADMCKTNNIPFPEVNIPDEDVKKPKDFYVFKGQNTPTVIHIPLFNVVNCGGDIETYRKKYSTFHGPYSAEMIPDLVEVAGKNITNNKDKMLEQIHLAIKNRNNER